MKRKICILISVFLISALFPHGVFGENNEHILYFCEDFDKVRGSLTNSMEFTPKNNAIGVEAISEENKSLFIEVKSRDEAKAIKRFSDFKPSGEIVIEYDMMIGKGGGCEKRLSLRNSDNYEIYPVTINSGGEMSVMGGKSVLSVAEGKFYSIAIALNLNNKEYDLFVNGIRRANKVSMQSVLGGRSFNELALAIFDVAKVSEGCSAKYYVDNIKIYNGLKIIPKDEFANIGWRLETDYDTPISSQMLRCRMQNETAFYIGSSKALRNGIAEYIDEADNSIAPYIKDNCTMLPMRYLIESLGGNVSFSEVGSIAKGEINGKEITAVAGAGHITVDGKRIEMSAASEIYKSRFFIPMRAISEAVGKRVLWDKTGLVVLSDTEETMDWRKNLRLMYTAAGEMVYERPSGTEILDAMKSIHTNRSHPRIMADKETFDRIKREIKESEIKASWFENVRKAADALLLKDVSKYGKTDGVRMSDQANKLIDIASNCGMVYKITGERKYLERVIKEAEAIVEFPDFNPHHFLDVGRYMTGLALTYDWLYDDISDSLKQKIKSSLKEKAYSELMKDYLNLPRERGYSWSLSKLGDNWNTVINAGAIMSALAIGDEDGCKEICADVLGEAVISLENAFNMLAPDGSWYEGAAYWTQTARTMVFAMNTLQKACGTDYGFFKVPGLRESGYFLTYISGATGIFNFNYANELSYTLPDLFYYSERLGDTSLQRQCLDDMKRLNAKGTYLDLIYCVGEPSGESADVLPKDKYYRGAEVFTSRSSWDTKKMLFAGMHAGQNDAPNGQLDIGTFVIDSYGNRFVTDLGTENYNLQGTFEKYRNRAEGNNCIIINPSQDFYDQTKKAYAYIDRYESNDVSCYGITDMTCAYEGKVKSAKRGLKMTNCRTAVVVQDEIECIEPSEIYWGIHTKADINISEDGKTALLNINGNKMEVKIQSSDGVFSILEPKPLPQCYQLDGQNANEGVKKLAVHFVNAEKINLTVCFTPLGYADGVKVVYPEVKPLSKWTVDAENEMKKTEIPDLNEFTLNDLKLDGKTAEGFDPGKNEYKVKLSNRYAPMPKVEAFSECDTEVIYPKIWPSAIIIKMTKNGVSVNKAISFEVPPETAIDLTHEEIKVESTYAQSVTQDENPPENSLDNDFDTRFAGSTPNYIVYDIGEKKTVDKAVIAFYSGMRRKTIFSIEVSVDGEKWTRVFDGESSGTTDRYEYFDLGGSEARYIKINGYGTSTNEDWLSVLEFRVFAKKTK